MIKNQSPTTTLVAVKRIFSQRNKPWWLRTDGGAELLSTPHGNEKGISVKDSYSLYFWCGAVRSRQWRVCIKIHQIVYNSILPQLYFLWMMSKLPNCLENVIIMETRYFILFCEKLTDINILVAALRAIKMDYFTSFWYQPKCCW